jgi:thioredoxin 1
MRMAENVLEISDQNFETEVLAANKPVLVDFWAPWCGPCRVVAPIIEELAEKHGDKIKFTKLNVDENPKIATKFKILSIPTFIIFNQGAEQKRFMGAMPKDKFVQELSEWLED